MERAIHETDFDRIIDAVRKEMALAPGQISLLRLSRARESTMAAHETGATRHQARSVAVTRIRRLGERQKRYR